MTGAFLCGFLLAVSIGALVAVFLAAIQDSIEADDDVARAASGMDEFSAPEGGEPR